MISSQCVFQFPNLKLKGIEKMDTKVDAEGLPSEKVGSQKENFPLLHCYDLSKGYLKRKVALKRKC